MGGGRVITAGLSACRWGERNDRADEDKFCPWNGNNLARHCYVVTEVESTWVDSLRNSVH